MTYEMMIPPFKHGKFADMKKEETQKYFDWYTSEVYHRIDILKKYIEEEGSGIVLDYSGTSLIPLWEWYEKRIELVQKDKEEYENEVKRYPDWMKPEISTTKISFETLKYATDISMYFAEIVIRNSEGKIKWGYFTKPKKRMSVNQPTLLGFKGNMNLNPRLIVYNCTLRSSEEKESTRLFEIYKTWMSYIE